MNGWFWLAMILLLLTLLLVSRLKIRAEYDEDGFRAVVKFGLLCVFRYPGSSVKKTAKPKQSPKKDKERAKKEKKGGKLPDLREIISIISDTLGKLRRKLRVDELVLLYCSANADPAAAALAFGGASAIVGMLTAPLEQAFRIKKRDVRTAVSFTDTQPTVILKLCISVSLFSLLLGMALPAIVRFFLAMRNRER